MSRRPVCFCVLLAAFALAPASHGKVRVVQRTFPGGIGAALTADAYRGAIEVEASPDQQFHLEISLDPETDDPSESEHLLNQVQTEIKQDGAAITLRLRNPSETGPHFEFGDPPRVSIHCRCLVPAACSLDLSTTSGDITVGNLSGRLKARTKSGTIFFRHITGDVEASDEKGDIVLSHCDGAARLTVLLGNIRAGTVTGRVEASATNGDIEVQHAHGGGVVSATVGNARVGLPGDLAGAMRIDTDFGNIFVQIDPAAHCQIQAACDLGRIHLGAFLPVVPQTGGDGKKTLAGPFNGGGPLVALRAKGGEIRIEGPGESREQAKP